LKSAFRRGSLFCRPNEEKPQRQIARVQNAAAWWKCAAASAFFKDTGSVRALYKRKKTLYNERAKAMTGTGRIPNDRKSEP